MKASNVKVKTFSDATEAGLDTAVQSFLDALGEAVYLDLKFSVTDNGAPTFAAQLTYAT